MIRSTLLGISENHWCRHTLPKLGFVRRAVRRFLPGEELDDAIGAARALWRRHRIPALVTCLGEDVRDTAEAEEVSSDYVDAVEEIQQSGLDIEVSLKPTHLGLDLGLEVAEANISKVAKAAERAGNWVWLDMEYSRLLAPTLELYRRLRSRWEKVGICLQSYLRSTPRDLESLIELGPAIRLVKGAYAEPRAIAFPERADVDAAFVSLARRMLAKDALDAGMRAAFATHDARLLREIRGWAAHRGVESDRYEIQMLYGISRAEQTRLARAGAKMRVLISYGDEWFPWYVRRLAERPANLAFVARSMLP